MRVNLIMWEDILWNNFYPLTLTRPVFDLRVGFYTFRERAKRYFPDSVDAAICRDEMFDLMQEQGIIVDADQLSPSIPTILMCGRTYFDIRSMKYIKSARTPTVFVSENIPIALFFPAGDDRWRKFFGRTFDAKLYRKLFESFDAVEITAVNLNLIWELMVNNPDFIEGDFNTFFRRNVIKFTSEPRAVLYNPDDIYVGQSVKIDAYAVLDAREGPIIIGKNSHIHSGAVIIGPVALGEGTIVMPYARIREGTTTGPQCRLGGEVEATIFNGYSNKYHDGFIGHSYIGEWVNFGALTTNSDLKNNYSPIKVAMPEGPYLTGYNKVGIFVGDHTKFGIGTLISSGSTVGVGVNFYGGGTMPKYTPSFIWGSFQDGFTHYDLDKALETANIVMKRRNKELTKAQNAILRKIHSFFADDRTNFIFHHPKK